MRSTLILVGLLLMAVGLSACQGSTGAQIHNPPICTPRAQDAGHCYGFALPSNPGV